jgi:hypothetical protein
MGILAYKNFQESQGATHKSCASRSWQFHARHEVYDLFFAAKFSIHTHTRLHKQVIAIQTHPQYGYQLSRFNGRL